LHSIQGDVNVSRESALDGLVVADVMLREPKTLPGDARVHEVRAQLENPKMQMVLLADNRRFVGAITAIPAQAPDEEAAVAYADPKAETISADAPSAIAFEQAFANPHRRVVVLDDDGTLLGLLCLNEGRTRFCQKPS
jgi:CBS domain-containing protein